MLEVESEIWWARNASTLNAFTKTHSKETQRAADTTDQRRRRSESQLSVNPTHSLVFFHRQFYAQFISR